MKLTSFCGSHFFRRDLLSWCYGVLVGPAELEAFKLFLICSDDVEERSEKEGEDPGTLDVQGVWEQN